METSSEDPTCLSCSWDAAPAQEMQESYPAGHYRPEFPAAVHQFTQQDQQLHWQHSLPPGYNTAPALQHYPSAQQVPATLQQSPWRAAQHVRPAINTSQRISTSSATPRPFMSGFLLPAAEQKSQVGTVPVAQAPAPASASALRSVASTLDPRPLAQSLPAASVSAPGPAPADRSEFERMLQLEIRKAIDAVPQRKVR